MTEVLLLVLAMILVAACGGFVAAEFAFITVSRPAVENAADDGDARATGVLKALRTLSTQLSGAQVGITITNLAIGFLARPSIAELLRDPLTDAGLSTAAVESAAIAIALVLVTVVTMVFGELVPKNLAISRPLATARAVQGFQRGFTTVMAYPIRFFNGTANRILRAVGIEPQEELASARSAEELGALVRHSAARGTLAADTADLVQRSLAFGDRRARDAMTPRSQMHVLAPEATVHDLVVTAQTTGHSRFPVIDTDEGAGEPGIAHLRAGLAVPFEERATTPVSAIAQEATLRPDTIELDELMDDLRDGSLQIALLIDEFGGIAGLVTLEDLVEELVGEVRDEHDTDEQPVEQESRDSWVLPAILRIHEASHAVGVELPDDEAYDTLAGWITVELGRIAETGDAVRLPTVDHHGHDPLDAVLTVLEMDGHRIDTVRLHLVPRDVPEDAEAPAAHAAPDGEEDR